MSEDESPRSDPHSGVPAALLPWQKKPRFSWTPAYETTFFQSLCQSVQLGLRENQSFKQEAWNRALVALREQGAYPTKPHLINKTDNARKKFRLWRGLVENNLFNYNPVTKTITGSEEAWQAHLEKEPLARAFRDRPFENAEYLEILFPDVVGSRGHPKRVTRPRRKGPDTLPDGEAPPGTSVMRLQNGAAGVRMNQGAMVAPTVGSTPVPLPSNAQVRQQHAAAAAAQAAAVQAAQGVSNTGVAAGVQIRPAQNTVAGAGGNPTATPIQPPPAPGVARQMAGGVANRAGNNNTLSALALTPPEDGTTGAVGAVGAAGTQQKRFSGPGDGSAMATSKRRRTESSINTAGNNNNNANTNSNAGGAGTHRNRSDSHAGTTGAGNANAAGGGSATRVGGGGGPVDALGMASGGNMRQAQAGGAVVGVGGGGGGGGGASMAASRVDGIAGLLSDVLTKYASATTLASTTRWPEQALEIFFQEFADEDMDLQLRIAEKILTDTSKAVMFCKMPSALRKHWVKRLREVSSRLGN